MADSTQPNKVREIVGDALQIDMTEQTILTQLIDAQPSTIVTTQPTVTSNLVDVLFAS